MDTQGRLAECLPGRDNYYYNYYYHYYYYFYYYYNFFIIAVIFIIIIIIIIIILTYNYGDCYHLVLVKEQVRSNACSPIVFLIGGPGQYVCMTTGTCFRPSPIILTLPVTINAKLKTFV